MAVMGRPSIYTDEIADEICKSMISGQTIRKICAREGMPSIDTLYNWLAKKPHFSEQYLRARELQADAIFDECLDIADDANNDFAIDGDGRVIIDHNSINRAKLMIDTRKWMAGKMRPKRYGEKIGIGGTEDLPPVQMQQTINVAILSLEQLEALQAALIAPGNMIEHEEKD
jgi:hypothetical protein